MKPIEFTFHNGVVFLTLQKVKYRKRLKVKLEMAKFLQDTVEEISLQKKGAQSEKVHEFKQFMEKVSTRRVKDDNGMCRENTAKVVVS